jgi:hypothetical protein
VEVEWAYFGVGTEVMTIIFINSVTLTAALYFSPFGLLQLMQTVSEA